MDWQGLFNGLGNAGDILAGSESFNSIKRGNQNNALARDQLGWQANNAQANRAQEGMLQQNLFGQQSEQQRKQQEFLKALETMRQIDDMLKLQKQQEFLATQEQKRQSWTSGENTLDRTNAMDRTMKPLEFQYDRNPMNQPISMGESTLFGNSGIAGITPGRLQALGQGAIGQATVGDPMMTKAFGNTFTQMQNNATIKQIIDSMGLGQGLNSGSVSPFQSQRGPAGLPLSTPAPQQRKGNY